jgi:hypothetical protein
MDHILETQTSAFHDGPDLHNGFFLGLVDQGLLLFF